MISHTEVIATYDNYGDALLVASYNATLTSKPTANVVLSMSSSSPVYTTVVPSSGIITFTPENWNRPMTVSVASTALTEERPACPDGSEFDEVRCGSVTAHEVCKQPVYDPIVQHSRPLLRGLER